MALGNTSFTRTPKTGDPDQGRNVPGAGSASTAYLQEHQGTATQNLPGWQLDKAARQASSDYDYSKAAPEEGYYRSSIPKKPGRDKFADFRRKQWEMGYAPTFQADHDRIAAQGIREQAAANLQFYRNKKDVGYGRAYLDNESMMQAVRNAGLERQLAAAPDKEAFLNALYANMQAGFKDAHKTNKRDRNDALWSNTSQASAAGAGFFSGGREHREDKLRADFRSDRRQINRDTEDAATNYQSSLQDLQLATADARDELTIGHGLADKLGIDRDVFERDFKRMLKDKNISDANAEAILQGKHDKISADESAALLEYATQTYAMDVNTDMNKPTYRNMVRNMQLSLNPAAHNYDQFRDQGRYSRVGDGTVFG